ncbi:uncharacterized protein LOC111714267 [Eurytemora carolleeae]|uniref:uncharacterized protein LOC111714267 n=1 Tax=Eurytemora carolleeae TaxID=1294199 RepID=UPI000C771831|nr:uncharacterized protein LOC111714267 [Eurytemora carolleeae]|eukprot:XP_023345100.1 uncharacterized protein LOC111714267 [Eurytemora affinis]
MTVTSMAATSKIPLPKSAVSSPSGGGSSPAVSKIPVKKDFRSPGYSNLNKENCDGKRLDASPLVRPDYGLNGKGIESRVVDGKELDYKGLNGGKQSRIPDIRSKRSPQKEVISSRSRTDLYRDVSDMSTDDQRSSRSTRSRSISTSSEPRSGDTSDQTDGCVLRPPEPRRNDGREARPSQLTLTGKAKTSKSVAGSRIPLSPSMLDRDLRSVSGSRKASIESLTNLSPEWETQMSYEELAEPLEIDCSRTSKSRSDSPGKRGRPSSPAVCKMRRTSPDGESVSPSKTRKPRKTFIQFGNIADADDDVGGGGEGLGELGVDLGDGHHVGPVHDLLFRQGLHLGNRPTLFPALSCPPPPYPLPRPRPQRGSSTPPPAYPPSTQRNSLFIIFIVLRQIKGLFYLGNGRGSILHFSLSNRYLLEEDENNPANGLATTTSQEQEQDQDQAKQRSNQDEDEYLGQSCHTLHSECSTAPPPPSLGAPGPGDGTSSSEYSSKSKPSSTDQLISQPFPKKFGQFGLARNS